MNERHPSGVRLTLVTCFAIVAIFAMLFNRVSAVTAVVMGGVFFTLAYLGELLFNSDLTVAWVRAREEQETTRRLHLLQHQPHALPSPESFLLLPEERSAPAGRFVSPHSPTTVKDAYAWALTLYGLDGQPNPQKVNLRGDREEPGRLKVAMPQDAQVKAFLLDKKVIVPIDHGYRLHLGRYGTVEEVRALLPYPAEVGVGLE